MMKLLKSIQYIAKYKNNIVYCNYNLEVFDGNSILDLDSDINTMKEEIYTIYGELLDYIVTSKKISKHKVISKNFSVIINIAYTDINKCIDGYDEKYKECKTNKEYFNNYARSLKYKFEFYKYFMYKSRYECYGYLDTTMKFQEEFEHRYELADYYCAKELYSFGDVVKFTHKNKIYTGIIIGVLYGEEIFYSRLYNILVLKGNKVIKYFIDGDEIHHDDIFRKLSNNKELASKLLKNL